MTVVASDASVAFLAAAAPPLPPPRLPPPPAVSSNSTSPGTSLQPWNLHDMKARPAVAPRSWPSRPNDVITGTCAEMLSLRPPSDTSVVATAPRRAATPLYTAPMSSASHWTSTWNMGSTKRGSADSTAAFIARLAAGMTWLAPRWAASLCVIASRTSMRTPRSCSPASGPSAHTCMNAATIESLIALMFCTPCVQSTSRFVGAMCASSGPKAQILRASPASQPCSVASTRARVTASSSGPTSPSSSLRTRASSSADADT
mmetsp:Transcript_16270/g.56844  ORF Transcript_16270/g.56844 Transcript_16270/m.56844 type:complete len:260 (-) Transcript_16270:552-1331(-)